MALAPTQLAWMAAVIEMRGRVKRIDTPSRRNPQLKLYVNGKHVGVMRRLAELTGTELTIRESRVIESKERRGCTEHCPEPHVHYGVEMPSVASWDISGPAAAVVLMGLRPYLTDPGGMQSFVDEVIAQTPKSGRGRAAIDRSINRLRALGWDIPDELEGDAVEPVEAGAVPPAV